MLFKLQVAIPALDRLLDYLVARDKSQAEVDAATSAISGLTERLGRANDQLQSTIEAQKGN